MKVAIVMGSKSDYPVVEKAEAMLREFGVDYETQDHLRPQNAEAGRRVCCQCGSKRIWYYHRSGRKGCSSGRRAGSNHASSGHWTADEIQHHGRSGFPAFCRTDAERRTGSHRSHKRGRKRCDPGSTDPGGTADPALQPEAIKDFKKRQEEEIIALDREFQNQK